MASSKGKRKRRVDLDNEDSLKLALSAEPPSNRLQELLKLHFETQFEPLPALEDALVPPEVPEEPADSDDASDADWEGLSDEEFDAIEVVHSALQSKCDASLNAHELKTFMVRGSPLSFEPCLRNNKTAKPPSSSESRLTHRSALSRKDDAEDAAEKANLKNDVSLQRLLRESHLLDDENFVSQSGLTRHKALDLRLRDLGSKDSIFSQKKMPIAQRQGISASVADSKEKRRREARENGIILEKVGKADRQSPVKRQKGIGAPSVGKFRGGTLHLSKGDVNRIQGPGRTKR